MTEEHKSKEDIADERLRKSPLKKFQENYKSHFPNNNSKPVGEVAKNKEDETAEIEIKI